MGAAPSYTEPRVDVGRWRRDRAELDADEAPSAESATVGAKRAANRAWAASVAASSPAAAPQPAAGERSAADVANARAGASASTRDLHADVPRLQREWLGRFIPPLGGQVKAAVMQLAVRGVMPKFNKYSGIIEWANAFFLCVNIGGDNYRNVFLDDGRRMTWFAQVRMRARLPGNCRVVRLMPLRAGAGVCSCSRRKRRRRRRSRAC